MFRGVGSHQTWKGCYSRQILDLPLNTSSKRHPALFKHPKEPTDRLRHRQATEAHYLGLEYSYRGRFWASGPELLHCPSPETQILTGDAEAEDVLVIFKQFL